MYSITKRVTDIKQPYGCYLPRREFCVVRYSDDKKLNPQENVSSALVGLAVDYLTRVYTGTKPATAFKVSIFGARRYDTVMKEVKGLKTNEAKRAKELLTQIGELNKDTVRAACKLCGYDVCTRDTIVGFQAIDQIEPDDATCENIITMVQRAVTYFTETAMVKKVGFNFEGAYTDMIDQGEGDILTSEGVWDITTSKNKPNSKDTLKVLIWYIMGKNSKHAAFKKVKMLGIFNARRNEAYFVYAKSVPEEVEKEVAEEVIGLW